MNLFERIYSSPVDIQGDTALRTWERVVDSARTQGWLFYPGEDDLADLFSQKHSYIRIPKRSHYSHSRSPLLIFEAPGVAELTRVEQPNVVTRGMVWSNGAILALHTPKISRVSLLVDERTAQVWSYPHPARRLGDDN